MNDLLCKHSSIFSDCPGKTDSATHMIVTEDKGPIVSHPYRLCPAWKDQVRQGIETLLSGGIIRESTSLWASPIVQVQKHDGKIRLCIDFRKLNGITQPDPYYMPLVEETLCNLGEAEFLSKLDLSKQIPVTFLRQHL